MLDGDLLLQQLAQDFRLEALQETVDNKNKKLRYLAFVEGLENDPR